MGNDQHKLASPNSARSRSRSRLRSQELDCPERYAQLGAEGEKGKAEKAADALLKNAQGYFFLRKNKPEHLKRALSFLLDTWKAVLAAPAQKQARMVETHRFNLALKGVLGGPEAFRASGFQKQGGLFVLPMQTDLAIGKALVGFIEEHFERQPRAVKWGAAEVIDGFLWVGSIASVRNRDALRANGITHILNVAENNVPGDMKDVYEGEERLSYLRLGVDGGISCVFQQVW